MFVAGCCVVGTAPPAGIPASSCLTSAAPPVVGAVVLLAWRSLTRKKIEEPRKIAKRTLQVMLEWVAIVGVG